MTTARRIHRILGLVLLLPILGWAGTAFVFFVKPGYEDAYAGLRVRSYPLERTSIPALQPGWLELRALRTILGEHLLVRTEKGWDHLDPGTLQPREVPAEEDLRRLLGDAISGRKARYGEIVRVERGDPGSSSIRAETSTGVEIDLDWTTLSLGQSGRDTRRIDTLYRIHYLQWTGVGWLDRIVGAAGLGVLVLLALLGLRLALPGGRR